MTDEVEHKIIFTFKDDGSSLFTMEAEGVIYANQFLLLGNFCEFQGKQMLNDQRMAQMLAEQERENRNRIVIPKSKEDLFRQ